MDARTLGGDQIMGSNAGDATIGQAMHGYVIPIFLDLLFMATWAMTAMKAMGGAFSSGAQAKAGWCRMLCLVLCVFQSFYGFMIVHSQHQAWALLLMIFPLVGFIAFNGNNPKWLLGYARPPPTTT